MNDPIFFEILAESALVFGLAVLLAVLVARRRSMLSPLELALDAARDRRTERALAAAEAGRRVAGPVARLKARKAEEATRLAEERRRADERAHIIPMTHAYEALELEPPPVRRAMAREDEPRREPLPNPYSPPWGNRRSRFFDAD